MTHQPVLACTREKLAAAPTDLKRTRALVMVMSAPHKGHLQLVKRTKELGDHMVVAIFVNPTQFAPGEGFDAYPRTLDMDVAALESVDADFVWTPSPGDAYPEPVDLSIDPDRITHVLEGIAHPTHFAGVALVCMKVAGLIRSDATLFDKKDARQFAIPRHIFPQLDVFVRVRGVPVVRDTDGVALSSRSHYLLEDGRVRARSLSRGLEAGREAAANGAGAEQTVTAVLQVLGAAEGIDVGYVALVDKGTFDILAGTPGVALVTKKDARPATMVEGG